MKRVGEGPWGFWSNTTCQHGGRLFNVSLEDRMLVVTEALLGERAEFVRVRTGVHLGTKWGWKLCCCSLGRHILALSACKCEAFAAQIDVDEGRLSESTLHVARLPFRAGPVWHRRPYLCGVTPEIAMLCFDFDRVMYQCDHWGGFLGVSYCRARIEPLYGFRSVPIRLPDGRLLVAGARPYSADITRIVVCEKPVFEKVGEIPGKARSNASLVLVKERFVVGFGGHSEGLLSDLWVFDTETRRSSRVREEGEWHPPDYWVPMAVRGGTLYLVGGLWNRSVHAIALSALADLILDEELRECFREALGASEGRDTADT